MPARTMFFTFNKDIELNKENVEQLKEVIINYVPYEKELQKIKDAFCTEEFDKNFFKFFIKELKQFNSISVDEDDRMYNSDKVNSIRSFIYDILGSEPSEPETILGLKYLYDEWDYEGCGHDDHYYLTFASEEKEVKKFTKAAEEAVAKLVSIGIPAKLVIG